MHWDADLTIFWCIIGHFLGLDAHHSECLHQFMFLNNICEALDFVPPFLEHSEQHLERLNDVGGSIDGWLGILVT